MKKKVLKFILSIIITISLVTPLIYSFTFFNGFAGQIKPADYPRDWYEINDYLNEDGGDFKILFFPWHGYMDFRWVNNTDKRIANPAKYFFDKETISGTTVEIGDIYRQDNASDQIYIDGLLKKRNQINNFGELISILNVKYILLTKEVDYKKYSFLFDQADLELIKETETLYVFKNKNEVIKIFQTDDIYNISSEKLKIEYEKINPVRFRLKENVTKKYLVFTEAYNSDWEFDGNKGINAYNVVNAFEVDGKGGEKEIRFERFYRINLPAYIISILTFVVLIILYIKDKR